MDNEKNPRGKPLKFKTVEILQEKIDDYFNTCDKQGEPYMITGLALHLDTTRETLCDYGRKDGYSDAIKKAKLKVESSYEKRLIKQGRSGDIFALKNFGWKDKQEVESKNITDIRHSIDPKSVEAYTSLKAEFEDKLKESYKKE